MYYEIRGDGDPLILIAGTGRDHGGWEKHVPEFSRHFRVFIYDHRGTGRSDKTKHLDEYTASTLADDLHLLMKAAGISHSHVIGQSLGSAVAQELAINHPELVRSLILCATWGRTDEWLSRIFDFMALPVERGDMVSFVRAAYPLLVSPKFFEENKDQLERMERLRLAMYQDSDSQMGLLGHLHADKKHDAIERLHRIKAPTLVAAGECDIQVPLRYSRQVCERIRGCRMFVFRGETASHFFYLEKFEEFLSLTTEFLRNCP